MKLSDLGEFGFIDAMRRWLVSGDAMVGVGDDAAVVDLGDRRIVATSDALVEGVHFRLDWSTASDVGFKAVSVNVSDIAAMGGTAKWLLVVLGAPPSTDVEVVESIYEGMGEACALYGTQIIGGDTVRSSELTLSVTAIGELEGEPILRSGAEAGDVLAVTGTLGRAAAGVNLLLSGDPKDVDPSDGLACLDAHRRPVARVREAIALKQAGVHAAIDVTDGLASDARRMAEASGVGVEIDGDSLPIAPEAHGVAASRGWDEDAIVLGGGEDLELLVALSADDLRASTVPLIEVGRVTTDGAWLVRSGERRELAGVGFDHFRGAK